MGRKGLSLCLKNGGIPSAQTRLALHLSLLLELLASYSLLYVAYVDFSQDCKTVAESCFVMPLRIHFSVRLALTVIH